MRCHGQMGAVILYGRREYQTGDDKYWSEYAALKH